MSGNSNRNDKKISPGTLLIMLAALLGIVTITSLILGQLQLAPTEIVRVFAATVLPLEQTWEQTTEAVLFNVRLPRVLAGILVGAGLSVSGAAFQGLFRNPLVSPHILGVSAGAGFGAALAILFFGSIIAIQVCSFAFGLTAVLLTYGLSRVYRSTPVLMLVLSGIIVGALFSACTSLLKYIADPLNTMPSIVFWLLGSLNNASMKDLMIAGPIIITGSTILLLIRWRINLLAMGEEEARALGLNTGRIRAVVIVCATMISAASVSIGGIIGWIGLVIPHIGRLLVGPDNRHLLPVAVLIGSSYLVAVDTIARTAMESEIPIGILTALVGAPIFAYLLRKNRSGW
jgi:iron complex transport system permease protein